MAAVGGPFQLEDQNGKPVTDADMKGRPFLVFFGYTHCPDICPTTLFELSQIMQKLGKDADRTGALFITVDPERDTPAALKDYLSNFDPHLRGLTGDPAAVNAAIKAYRVYAKKVPLKDGDYTMDHTAIVYLMDKDGRFVAPFNLKQTPPKPPPTAAALSVSVARGTLSPRSRPAHRPPGKAGRDLHRRTSARTHPCIRPLRKIWASPVFTASRNAQSPRGSTIAVLLDRKIVRQHDQSLRVFDLGAGQQQLVAGEAVDLAALQRRHAFVAVLNRDERDIEIERMNQVGDSAVVARAGDDGDFLPDQFRELVEVRRRVTRTPVDSTKTRMEKSTSFMRPSVTVEEPHSMSALSPATAENRVSTVTGTHSIFRSGT